MSLSHGPSQQPIYRRKAVSVCRAREKPRFSLSAGSPGYAGTMIVASSRHASFLSNSFLVGDAEGGTAVIFDTGAPIEPLLEAVEQHGFNVTHIFNTHDHHDHTIFNTELLERFDAALISPDELHHEQELKTGALSIVALSTPGHTDPHFSFTVDDGKEMYCVTGDVLFEGSVGGTLGCGPEGFALLKSSIMDVLMKLPHHTKVLPGHSELTTIGDEWRNNPFIRIWRGEDNEGSEEVRAAGHDGTLILWAGDYDGGNKAWVRFHHGGDAIVGGSAVERAAPANT